MDLVQGQLELALTSIGAVPDLTEANPTAHCPFPCLQKPYHLNQIQICSLFALSLKEPIKDV